MSRVRRISYAITPEGRRSNAIKQAIDLRDKVLSIVENSNFSSSTARKITKKAAFSVIMRSLEETKGLPLSLREHLAIKELNKYISLAKHNKSDFFYATNTDLLPISHPRSTREHSMTASALRIARSRWFAADPRITDEKAKAVLASAFESIPGSVEHLYYTSILLSLPQGMIPGEALIAASDGNSFESRSARARRQRRDRKGRFAYEGGGIRALIRRLNGDIFSLSGRVVANAKNSRDVEVEFPNGKIAKVNPTKGEYIKAVLPTPDGYSPEPIIPSVTDEVIDEKDLVFVDAPNGWEKDENYKDFGDKVERYVDSNKEFVVFVSKQDDGTKEYQILNYKNAEPIDVVKTWADVQDRLEGKEDQILNPKANLPFRQGLIPAEDRPGPNAYERLMAEKKDKENAIENRKAELKKNADDRVDALDRTVPEEWDIEEKNNALMLRRATEPADLENIYKQDNFVARVVEQGEILVKDKNNLLEDKVYQNWAYVDKDKDARATEYAQKAREEIKKFAPAYGYKEEDLNKIDSMSADEIASFFLDERLQPEGFADALDDYMNSAMVDLPSQKQEAKWKSFGEKLKIINDAGDFPSNDNKKKADLPKQPDAPVKVKDGFEFNYPAGAYKIRPESEYDIQGRVDEESTDFTDDPIELAQKQDERDILAALEQAVSPGEDGENALGVGALPFNKGDEFVPAEALFFALEEAGVDAPMELAKIYDKKLGNNNNEKALIDFRKKAETVSGNIPELAESFKKVTEQNPDLEPPTQEPKFDAKEMDLIPLPPLLEGLSKKELDEFNETKNHIPYLPKNEEIEMPEGYNPLSPEPFAAWKEVTAENPDPVLPEGFSDNPVFLAQEISTNDLLKELRRSVEPGNEVPGAAVIALPTDDGEDFVANVPGEAVRDALQLKGIDTNAELKNIAEEGFEGQGNEAPAAVAVDEPDRVVRLVVDGDVPLEKQIRDAIAAKLKVAFLYNNIERIVLPVEIFENPKNSNVNMRVIDANGDRKTFTLSKIENSKEGSPVAPEITDKEIFDRRMAGESLQDLADALGIPREEVRAREAKYARENPRDLPLNKEQMRELKNILGDDNFGTKDGYVFLRKTIGFGEYADEVSVYDNKKYDEEVANNKEIATIDSDGNIDWPTEEDFDSHSVKINNILKPENLDEKPIAVEITDKEILDADLVGIGENQEPQEIENIPVEQAKLDDNQEPKDKTYVEENPEVIKVNAFVEANAGRLAPTKARDVKTGDFLWNNFNKVYEEILDIQPAPFGRVRFLIKDPRNQKEYFRFFDRRSPIRNMRRLGTGEVPEDFRVPSEENKGDGPKRGRALRQPLEKRVEVVAGRAVGGFAYKEGFYEDKNGVRLKPGDKVRHGNAKKNEMYGEGVIVARAGDQIDEAKKVGGIGRGGKVYKDYVWVQIPGEAGPRLWKARMIVKQGDNVNPDRIAPDASKVEESKLAEELKNFVAPNFDALDNQQIADGLNYINEQLEIARNWYKAKKRDKATTVANAQKAIKNLLDNFDVANPDKIDLDELDAAIRRVNRTSDLEEIRQSLADFRDKLAAEKKRLEVEREKALVENIANPLAPLPDVDGLNVDNFGAVLDEIIDRLPSNGRSSNFRYLANAKDYLSGLRKSVTAKDDLVEDVNIDERLNAAINYLNRVEGLDATVIQKQLEDVSKLVSDYRRKNRKPFGKINMPFVDPIELREKRIADGKNKFNLAQAPNLKQEFADDKLFDDNAFLQPYKQEIQEFFAQEGEVPLAQLTNDARQAVAQHVRSMFSAKGPTSTDEKKARAMELATFMRGLHEEKLAFDPNRPDLGPAGEALKDIDFNAVFDAGQRLRNSKATDLVVNGQDTGFKIQLVGDGINQSYNFRLIHKDTGQVFYFKRERGLEEAEAEIASNQLARALGIVGTPVVVQHNNDAQVLIMTNAGDNMDWKEKPRVAGNDVGDRAALARRAALIDLIGLGILDAIIYNSDRHRNNMLLAVNDRGAVGGNGYEEIQLLPIDHGFAQAFQKKNRATVGDDPGDWFVSGNERDGGKIVKELAKDIGAVNFKELTDMTIQQAIQAIERGDYLGDINPANKQKIIDRLLALKGIKADKWKLAIAKKL